MKYFISLGNHSLFLINIWLSVCVCMLRDRQRWKTEWSIYELCYGSPFLSSEVGGFSKYIYIFFFPQYFYYLGISHHAPYHTHLPVLPGLPSPFVTYSQLPLQKRWKNPISPVCVACIFTGMVKPPVVGLFKKIRVFSHLHQNPQSWRATL